MPAYDMASLSNTLELSPDQTYSGDVDDVDGNSEDLVYGYDVISLSRAARLDNLVKLDLLNEESIVEVSPMLTDVVSVVLLASASVLATLRFHCG